MRVRATTNLPSSVYLRCRCVALLDVPVVRLRRLLAAASVSILNANWYKNLVVLFPLCVMMVALAGCAPKVIKVYEGPPGAPQKGDAIVQYASAFIGRPYRNGAKGPDSFDCSGFVYFVYKHYDVNVPYTTDELVRTGYQVPRENVLSGDLVVFTIKRNYHIGIMMNEREFLHASASKGIAVGNLELPYWRRSFSHFRRVL